MNSPVSPPSAASAGARPSVVQLAIKEKAGVYAAYLSILKDGGIFVPTTRDYRLGDDMYVLLTLPDDMQRYPVAGKVVWINPPRAAGSRVQGVGVFHSGGTRCGQSHGAGQKAGALAHAPAQP